MTEDTGIIPLRQSEDFDDVLTTIARDGAQRMLAAALVAEAYAFAAGFSEDSAPSPKRPPIGIFSAMQTVDSRHRCVHALALGSWVERPTGNAHHQNGPIARSLKEI